MLDWGKPLVLTLQNKGLPMLSTAVLCFHTKRKVYQCLLIVLITIQRSLEGDLVKDVLGMERCVLKEMGFV